VLAHLQNALLSRRQPVAVGHGAARPGGAHIGLEEFLVGPAQRQPRDGACAAAGPDGPGEPGMRSSAILRVEVAQDAEQNGQGGQPLQAIDHLEGASAAGQRPSVAQQSGVIGIDEQHGAEEIIGRRVTLHVRRVGIDVIGAVHAGERGAELRTG